jgi:hypothetical protein
MSLEYEEGIPSDLNLNNTDSVRLEMVLKERKELLKFFDEDTLYEDLDESEIYENVTHIFGTISDKIEFIGFKAGSGRMSYTGNPNRGHPFIQGIFKSNIKTLKIGLNKGIRYIKVGYSEAKIYNRSLESEANEDLLFEEEEVLTDIKDQKEKEMSILFPYLDESYLYLENDEAGQYYYGLYNYLSKRNVDLASYDEFYNYLVHTQTLESQDAIVIKKDVKKDVQRKLAIAPRLWNQISVKTLTVQDMLFNEKNLNNFIEKFIAELKSEIGNSKVNKKLVAMYNKNEKDHTRQASGDRVKDLAVLEEKFNKILNGQFKADKRKDVRLSTSFKTFDKECEDQIGNLTDESGFSQNTDQLKIIKETNIMLWKKICSKLFLKARKVVFVGLTASSRALDIMKEIEDGDPSTVDLEKKLHVLDLLIKFRRFRKKLIKHVDKFVLTYQGNEEKVLKEEEDRKIKKGKIKVLDFKEKKEKENKKMKEEIEMKRQELVKKYGINLDRLKQKFEEGLKKHVFELVDEMRVAYQIMMKRRFILCKPISYSDKDTPKHSKIFRNQSVEVVAEYTDDVFPPEKKSICPVDKTDGTFIRPDGITEADIKDWDGFSWARSDKILAKGYEIFYEGIQVTDIMQNKIGNCYFLSAVAALSIFPDLVTRLLREKDISPTRQYAIYIRKKGIWQLMLLDDYFPVHGKFKKAACCFSQDRKELWVMLLEKAWSKLNNSYAATIGGEPSEVFDVLTNASSEKIFFFKMDEKKMDKLWKKIVNGVENKFIMTVGTNQKETVSKHGLVAGHAYTLLTVNELENGTRLVKLRNPWSNSEWNGAWNDNDKERWTKEILEKLNYALKEKNNDGIFYMEFSDFIKYFFSVSICHIYTDFVYGFIKYKPLDALDPCVTVVKVDKATKAYFQLHQANPRFYNKTANRIKTALAFILICDENYKYITSACSDRPVTSIEVENLEPGYYYIYTDINYSLTRSKVFGYNITSYTKEPIMMERGDKNDTEANSILRDAIMDYSKRLNPEVVEESEFFSDEKDKYIKVYIKGKSKKFPFIFAMVDNPFTNIKAEVKFTLGEELSLYEYKDYLEYNDERSITRYVYPEGDDVFLVVRHYNSTTTDIEWDVSCIPENDKALQEILDKKGQFCQLDQYGNITEKSIEYKNGYFILLTNNSENDFDLEIVLNNLKWLKINDNSKAIKFQIRALQAIMINLRTINRNQPKEYYYKYDS